MAAQMKRMRGDEAQAAVEQPPLKSRADTLSEGAEAAKRGADGLYDGKHARARSIAGLTAAGGVLAFGFAVVGALGYGEPRVLSLLAGLAALAPTAFAISRAVEHDSRLKNAVNDRGLCQGIAAYARRLGDSVGATDERNIALPADAVINSQLDILFKDLDRAKQRLSASGADLGPRGAAPRWNDRIVPDQAKTSLVGTDGRRYPVWIAELSLASVVVRGNIPLVAQNEQFQVGSRKAKVTSFAGNRATFTFMTPIVASEFNRKIVL